MLKHLLVPAAMVAGLVGVGAPAQADDMKVVIGVSIPSADHGWTGGLNYHAKLAAEDAEKRFPGLKVIVKAAADEGSQANDLEDLATVQKVNALVVLPTNGDPLTAPIAEFKKKTGAFITVVDRGLTDKSIQDLYVAGDNPGMGRSAADFFKKTLNGKGDIVVLRGIPTPIDTERFDAFVNGLKGTDIHILANQFANWNRDDGFKVMQDFLTRFKHIDAVWAQDDDIAIGVLDAIKQSKRESEMWVVGGGGMKEFVKKVMDGDKQVPTDVLYPPAMIENAIYLTAMHFYTQAPVRGTYIVAAPVITKDNAKEFYDPKSLY